MNILLLGTGGREHAIAWKLLASRHLKKLYLNASTGAIEVLSKTKPEIIQVVPSDCCDDLALLTQFSKQHNIDLIVIGSETPLALGWSDALSAAGLKVFGPSQAGARLESSKAFAKAFMKRHGIPTAQYAVFSDYEAAYQYIQHSTYPIVIKASGLAGGKGVFLPDDLSHAQSILQSLLKEKHLGEAGGEVVIEERLVGTELSLHCFSDGESWKVMPPARDHKRLYDGNKGPNTGGMGVYAPVALPSNISMEILNETILKPTFEGLKQEKIPFCGVLYPGLMLTAQGPKVLEFNCRFGDPETQVLLPLLKTDLIDILKACTTPGKLKDLQIEWDDQYAVSVVIASHHYPEKSSTPSMIKGLEALSSESSHIFQAGTRYEAGEFWATGGRVLNVTAIAKTLDSAKERAYQRVDQLAFEGMQYRRDIGCDVQGACDSAGFTYEKAGVNIASGKKAVALMSKAVQSTYTAAVLSNMEGFGGIFSAQALKNREDPVLVSSTDGVGTKVILGMLSDRLEGLGYDIVNHCVNDILVHNAIPLFFLDYIASAHLDPNQVSRIVSGMADACKLVGCALIGGETAEMPGVYLPQQLDIAGTMVGVAEKAHLLPKKAACQPGDSVWGLESSGPHTNGYSLLRQIFSDISLDSVLPELGEKPLVDILLTPHRCYLPILKDVLKHPSQPIKALAHITGGGFVDNIPRVLPAGVEACIAVGNWPIPPLFQYVQQRAGIPFEQLWHVLNMGIGMVLITDPQYDDLISQLIPQSCWKIGLLKKGARRVYCADTL